MAAWNEDVEYIVEDVKRHFKKASHDRKRTAFFWAVQGGNIELVRNALIAMQEHNMESELCWLLNNSDGGRRCGGGRHHRCLPTILLFLGHLIAVTVTFLLALTPLFRIYHWIVSKVVSSEESSADSDLPLYLAALSRSPEMIQLFMKYGVTLNQTDDLERNIFHVLVNYSSSQVGTIAIYKMIIREYSDHVQIKHAILKQTNLNGLTAMEACVKYGCATLLGAFFDTENVIRTTVASTSRHQFILQNKTYYPEDQYNARPCHNRNRFPLGMKNNLRMQKQREHATVQDPADSANSFQRIQYDVSEYETGGLFNKQSLLLLLLTYRNLSLFEAEVVEQLWRNPLLSRWSQLKKSAVMPLFVMDQIFRLGMFATALYYTAVVVDDLGSLPMVNQFAMALHQLQQDRLLNASIHGIMTTVADVCEQKHYNIGKLTLNDCEYHVLHTLSSKCDGDTVHDYIIDAEMKKVSDMWIVHGSSEGAVFGLVVAAFLILAGSVVAKLTFLVQTMRHYSLGKGVRRVFAAALPGSGFDDFLRQITSWSIFMLGWLITRINSMDEFSHSLAEYIDLIKLVFIVYVMTSCLSWILAIRLWPMIGFFVVVTQRLLGCLCQFLFLYGTILLTAASLFHYVMREPECQLQTFPNYHSLPSSMFETFKLTFSAGDFVYGVNIESKILYMIFTVSGSLLMLNLIIAVMSSITDRLFTEPWQSCIWEQEHLREYLGLESGVNILIWLFRAHTAFLKRLGYVVKKHGQEQSVFIEIEKTVSPRDANTGEQIGLKTSV